ncbi:site-specific DNA-methyltransferase [Streptococcus tangpeifui]|uniref:site-specific DNA-methyltransferase n=1 Tax=Streptococcus tangpeifui TaxID=2709400 RepID=UPI0013ED8266|nr:site-specific DNA-methyltransferase [Streptococcus sp. ZJ373]
MPSDFNERPHQNEKAEALAYVRHLMEQARKESNHEDLPKLEKLVELIDSKRYGLVWEEHAELVEEEMETKFPVFIEDETRKIHGNPDSTDYNFLLEGDNLHSLHLLEKTHKGMIDVIYIDPPYNTGNKDFVYNDKIVDKTDGYSHSKWLSFMSKRLEIAQKLLSETGVIFISIDDNEQAQLKLLCDQIFGKDNFIATLPRLTKKAGKNQQATYAGNHDYIICYAKNKSKVKFIKKEVGGDNYPLKDKHFDERGGYKLNQTLDYATLGYVRSLDYPITIGENTYYPGSVSKQEYLDRKANNPQDGYRWRWSSEKLEYGLKNDFVVAKKSRNGIRLYTKTYFKVSIIRDNGRYTIKNIDRTIPPTTLDYVDNSYSNDNAKKNIDALKLGRKFDYSKPILLIKQIISLFTNNSTILDFFAGSGTTGHAVAQLNKEDGGNRKYILCTNNENNICEEVTYKRLANIQKELPHNLKYFKTQFIEKDDDDLEYTLLNNVKTLIELEHGIDLEESDKAVAFSLSEIRNLDLTGIKTVYVRQHSHVLMEKEDRMRYQDINLVDVPEYYFAKEMREAGL